MDIYLRSILDSQNNIESLFNNIKANFFIWLDFARSIREVYLIFKHRQSRPPCLSFVIKSPASVFCIWRCRAFQWPRLDRSHDGRAFSLWGKLPRALHLTYALCTSRYVSIEALNSPAFSPQLTLPENFTGNANAREYVAKGRVVCIRVYVYRIEQSRKSS